jgi:hypothetical protein
MTNALLDPGVGVLVTVVTGLLIIATWVAAGFAIWAAVQSYKASKKARKGK